MLAELCTLSDCIDLVKAEYLEMPGLHLTKPQIQRMWGLDDHTCQLLLDALVADGFLARTDRNAYALGRRQIT